MDRILTCEVGKILGHYGSFLAVEQADPESSTNSFKIVLPPLVTGNSNPGFKSKSQKRQTQCSLNDTKKLYITKTPGLI